jgi:hypothetical protein
LPWIRDLLHPRRLTIGINLRRKFLLTSDGKDDEPEINENEPGFKQEMMDEDVYMKEEKHELVAEAVGYI